MKPQDLRYEISMCEIVWFCIMEVGTWLARLKFIVRFASLPCVRSSGVCIIDLMWATWLAGLKKVLWLASLPYVRSHGPLILQCVLVGL